MTTPALVPDIGIMSGWDMVSLEQASVDAVKMENLIPQGIPDGMELREDGHLFYRLHGKDPYVQIEKLEEAGLGTKEYTLTLIK